MAFENSVVPRDWRSTVIVSLYKEKGEVTECKNCRGVSLFSIIRNIYAGILVGRVLRVTEDLNDDGQRNFRSGRVCV